MNDKYEAPDSKQWDAAREVWAQVGITIPERPKEESHHYLANLLLVVVNFEMAKLVSERDRDSDLSFDDLANRSQDLKNRLSKIDDIALARLDVASSSEVEPFLAVIKDKLIDLEKILRNAKSPRIPRKKKHEHNDFLVVLLANHYEQTTGLIASVTTDPIKDERKGPFVDFVACFSELFLPDETLDLNGRAIQRALKARRDNPDPLG